MKKFAHFLKLLTFGLFKKNFRLKTIGLIFPKSLVVLRRECAWVEGEVVLTNVIMFNFQLLKTSFLELGKV